MTTIAHLSDLHFGRLDVEVAEALVPYLNGLSAELVVVSGDLSQRAKASEFGEAMGFLGRLGGEKLIVPGNHDVPLYAVWERFLNPLGRYKRYVSGDLSPRWEGTDAVVVGVNTARAFVPVWDGYWKDGSLRTKSLATLLDLSESASGKLQILVVHHPLLPSPGTERGGTLLASDPAASLLAASRVEVVLAGHLHASYHGERLLRFDPRHLPAAWLTSHSFVEPKPEERTVLSLQAGTATSYRRRHDPGGNEYPNSFNLLRVSRQGEGVELKVEVHAYQRGGARSGWSEKSAHFFGRNDGNKTGLKPRS